MPEVTITGILQRLELLEAKVASLIENAGAPIQDTALPPDPDSNNDDRRLPAAAVAARYGVVPRTIDRWLARAELNFPRPHRVNRRRYWWLSQLRNWDRSRALKAAHVATQDLGR
jgi:predicted DNA-binding transcriptional regulator AlpA